MDTWYWKLTNYAQRFLFLGAQLKLAQLKRRIVLVMNIPTRRFIFIRSHLFGSSNKIIPMFFKIKLT